MGSMVAKPNAKKIRRIGDTVIAGFAGSAADGLVRFCSRHPCCGEISFLVCHRTWTTCLPAVCRRWSRHHLNALWNTCGSVENGGHPVCSLGAVACWPKQQRAMPPQYLLIERHCHWLLVAPSCVGIPARTSTSGSCALGPVQVWSLIPFPRWDLWSQSST